MPFKCFHVTHNNTQSCVEMMLWSVMTGVVMTDVCHDWCILFQSERQPVHSERWILLPAVAFRVRSLVAVCAMREQAAKCHWNGPRRPSLGTDCNNERWRRARYWVCQFLVFCSIVVEERLRLWLCLCFDLPPLCVWFERLLLSAPSLFLDLAYYFLRGRVNNLQFTASRWTQLILNTNPDTASDRGYCVYILLLELKNAPPYNYLKNTCTTTRSHSLGRSKGDC